MTQPATIGEGWRDIASAPKDGTPVMIWSERHELLPAVFWSEGREAWMYVLPWGPVERCYSITDATHWMPLPNPPASATDAPYPGRGHSTSPRTSSE